MMQGQNKYYPPDFDPKEHGTINKYRGKDVRPDTVRFEMPWSASCNYCHTHLGKGLRFNVYKKHAGFYYTTRIVEFHMTCPQCSGRIVLKTDPQNRDYAVVEGVTRSGSGGEEGMIVLGEDEKTAKKKSDALARLEKKEEDKEVAKMEEEKLTKLQYMRDAQYGDDYRSSKALREGFRKRKAEEIREETSNAKKNIYVPMLKETPDDVIVSKTIKFSHSKPRIITKAPTSIFGKKK